MFGFFIVFAIWFRFVVGVGFDVGTFIVLCSHFEVSFGFSFCLGASVGVRPSMGLGPPVDLVRGHSGVILPTNEINLFLFTDN